MRFLFFVLLLGALAASLYVGSHVCGLPRVRAFLARTRRYIGAILGFLWRPLRTPCMFLWGLLRAFSARSMRFIRWLFSLDLALNKYAKTILALLPFVLFIVWYVAIADARHAANPMEKITPTGSQLVQGIEQTLFEKDENGELIPLGDQRLIIDLKASLSRFGIGIALASTGILLGLLMRLPVIDAAMQWFVLVFEKVPPLALLALLFVVFGSGDEAKIALVFLGVWPKVVLDTYLNAKAIPQEQIIKGKSLGGTDWRILWRIIAPQVLPRAWTTIRLSLGLAVGFLIAAEGIAAEAGLGYRIFVVRRYMAMNIIIDYVIIIAIFMFIVDRVMILMNKLAFPWNNE